jgi:hypothetical protein
VLSDIAFIRQLPHWALAQSLSSWISPGLEALASKTAKIIQAALNFLTFQQTADILNGQPEAFEGALAAHQAARAQFASASGRLVKPRRHAGMDTEKQQPTSLPCYEADPDGRGTQADFIAKRYRRNCFEGVKSAKLHHARN